jgi:hypothetical protein
MFLIVSICAIVGAIVILLLLWITIIAPFIHYLKRVYIFYVLKKVRVAHNDSIYCYFFGPNRVETITRKDYKKVYGCEAKFKYCY